MSHEIILWELARKIMADRPGQFEALTNYQLPDLPLIGVEQSDGWISVSFVHVSAGAVDDALFHLAQVAEYQINEDPAHLSQFKRARNRLLQDVAFEMQTLRSQHADKNILTRRLVTQSAAITLSPSTRAAVRLAAAALLLLEIENGPSDDTPQNT